MREHRKAWLGGLAAAMLLAAFLSPWASPWPDGLERVAERLGFAGAGRTLVDAPLPDYQIPGLRSERLGTALAGIAGTLVVFGVAWAAGYLLRRRARS